MAPEADGRARITNGRGRPDMPSVLISCGAGFVGSHVTEMFLALGYTVAVIDDLSTGKRENVDARATLHELDVRLRESTALLGELRPDVIVHLAAQVEGLKVLSDPLFGRSRSSETALKPAITSTWAMSRRPWGKRRSQSCRLPSASTLERSTSERAPERRSTAWRRRSSRQPVGRCRSTLRRRGRASS